MSLEITSIPQGVLAVELDGSGYDELLALLMQRERNDATALGAVRYLFHRKLWDSSKTLAGDVLQHFYAVGGGVLTLEADEYIRLTTAIIAADYGYEIPAPVPYVAPPREDRPQRDYSPPKKAKRPAVERHERRGDQHVLTDLTEGESGSRTFKSIADHEATDGASKRMKKVIGIQRGG